jgi:hypothetical protein
MASTTFKVLTPHMKSEDVRAFQAVINARFAAWSIDFEIAEDGDYAVATRDAAKLVCHGLGLSPASYGQGITPAARIKIRNPDKRSPAEIKRALSRREWLAGLRKRMAAAGGGAAEAIAYGRKHLGTHEAPSGSNRGPLIDQWNRDVNSPPGPMAYWCGAFVNACLHAGGFPHQPFLVYCPNIEGTARTGTDGYSWYTNVADGKPGDLVLYTEGGQPEAAHVELLVAVLPGHQLDVIGGNTSATPASGSQSNGGCVAEHHRDPTMSSLKFKGYARPPWSKV